MSYSGIQTTVNFLTMQEASLTNELTDIMTAITMETRECATLAEDVSSQKEAVKAEYDVTDTEYKIYMDDIRDEYELKLADLTAWESELETQKNAKETEIQATSATKESYTSMLKENVQNDHKYAQS